MHGQRQYENVGCRLHIVFSFQFFTPIANSRGKMYVYRQDIPSVLVSLILFNLHWSLFTMVVNHFCRGIFMVDTNISMEYDYVMPIQNHNYEFLKWFMEWLITALDMASAESVSQIKGGFDRNHLRHQRPYHIWFHVLVSAVGFSLEILIITGRRLRSHSLYSWWFKEASCCLVQSLWRFDLVPLFCERKFGGEAFSEMQVPNSRHLWRGTHL